MNIAKACLAAIGLAASLALGARDGQATTYTWNNLANNGAFLDWLNWEPQHPYVPPNYFDAVIFDKNLELPPYERSNDVVVTDGTGVESIKVVSSAVVDLYIIGTMHNDFMPQSLRVGEATGETATLNLHSGVIETPNTITSVAGRATFNITGPTTEWLSGNVALLGDGVANTAGIGLGLGAAISSGGSVGVGTGYWGEAASGRIVVDGTVENLFDPPSRWTVDHSVDVGPAVASAPHFGQVTVQDGGEMYVTENVQLHGSSAQPYETKLTVHRGGKLVVGGTLTIGLYAQLELFDSGSKVTVGALQKTGGLLDWTGGTLEITASHLFVDPGTSPLDVGAGERLILSLADANNSLEIGRVGAGSMTIQSGGTVESYRGTIGSFGGGDGTVLVNGAGSAWTATEGLRVGQASNAVGHLTIQNEGTVHTPGWVLIGMFDQARGTVVVNLGGGLTSDTQIHVGGYGGALGTVGTLNVDSGGKVSAGGLLKVWNTGSVVLTSGGTQLTADEIALAPGASFTAGGGTIVRTNRLTDFGDAPRFYGNLLIGHAGGSGWGQHVAGPGQSLTVDQYLTIGEDALGDFWAYGAGTVSSYRGFIGGEPGSDGSQVRISDSGRTWTVTDWLHVGGNGVSAGGTARLTVANNAVVDAGNIKVWQPGTLELDNATVSADSVVLSGGTLTGNGAVNLSGELTNSGVVSPGLSPGMITINNGNYVQTAAGLLAIDIGGVHEGQFDRLEIHKGGATLGGGLQVSLFGTYDPPVGSEFQILWAEESLSGAFDPLMTLFPTLPGRRWNLEQRRGAVTLQVLSALLAGDYNQNGVVDAADYTVWRDTLGSTTDLRANGDNSGASTGVVDEADYALWKLHFGETAPGSGAGTAARDSAGVPEPATIGLLLIGGALLCGRMRKAAWLSNASRRRWQIGIRFVEGGV